MKRKWKKIKLDPKDVYNRKMNYRVQNILIHEAIKPSNAPLTFWQLLVKIGVIVNEGTEDNPKLVNDLNTSSEEIFNRCLKTCNIKNYGLYK